MDPLVGWQAMTWRNPTSERLSRRTLLRAAGLAGASGLAMLPRATTSLVSPPPGTGFFGRAIDLATLQPLSNALVQAEPVAARATTDQNGVYVLPLPPGTYTVHVSRNNYVGVIRLRQTVGSQAYTTLDLDLVPQNPTPAEQEAIYQRTVTQTEVSPPEKSALTAEALNIQSTTIPSQIKVVFPDGSYQWVPLEDYVKGVVPNEMPASWPAAALEAQAVAARTYGVARFLAYGFVCTTSACQVYDPTNEWPSTNAAVDATAGQIMTANG